MAPGLATERITLSCNTLLALVMIYTATRSYVPPSDDVTLGSSEAEFEKRRQRRETDLRNKDDLYRYIQRFKRKMPYRIRAEQFGPAVISPDVRFKRSRSAIPARRRRKRISHADLDRTIKV
ncbi:hypothetical protein BIW11_08784 [Tropilaelaps mercedesae]|uniref:Uncharacterized protein n=1 Tax=Tropilaelaps mercedesae TaxID=418985 RepID=A0A1V9XMZ8_9ACAR|nr:hypothetical protein BIW11_08784 [Tropilaelaps mercedesae]